MSDVQMLLQTLLQTLKAWSERGWIRRLDGAFAGFMVELCPAATAPVVMAAALVAHMEGRGHTCLLIDELLDDADAVLGWAPLASAGLHEAMASLPGRADDWLDALRTSPLVAVEGHAAGPGDADGHPPLVLRGSKLYLRRYWDYEQRVAAQVLRRGAALDRVDEAAARHWLDRLFPLPPPSPSPSPSPSSSSSTNER